MPNSLKVGNDNVHYEHEVTFNTCTITAVLYDDAEEDNDTIFLYYNNAMYATIK
ncbi:MAG: hypothetical protein IPP89_19890 [Saprospiraceae bacterium]|nr:hypothetical protein [Candidatus Brachybacter algidus]MBL0121153.1 hypothetical protein [Candidatus Brachybacter algidus]